MSDSTGRYIGDTDGSARTWRDDEILGGWNAEENKRTQSAQLQKYTVSIPQAELDALRARIRELEAQEARDKAVREAVVAIGLVGLQEIIEALSAYWADTDPLTRQVRDLRAALAAREEQ